VPRAALQTSRAQGTHVPQVAKRLRVAERALHNRVHRYSRSGLG